MSIKKILMTGLAAFLIFATRAVPVKADTATAESMIPVLRAMYHVDVAEANLKNKTDILNNCIKNNAPVFDTALAQAEVNAATNLLNSLNALVARDAGITGSADPLLAQSAWYDLINQKKAAQAALSSTYSNQLIASNQSALMNQAILAHCYTPDFRNPVSAQATANWVYLLSQRGRF